MPGNMQEGFGCAITNRFDQLLDDESDPFDILKAAKAKKESKAANKAAAAAKQPPKKESQKDRKAPLPSPVAEPKPPIQPVLAGPRKEGQRRLPRRPDQQVSGTTAAPPVGPENRTERVFSESRPERQSDARADRRIERPERRVFAPRPERRAFERPMEDKGEGSTEFSTDRSERPPRGRGVFRGGRARGRGFNRTDGFDIRGKREFDRHSGSDRIGPKLEEKRRGNGPHNWGSVKDEMGGLKPEDKRGGSGSHNWGSLKDDIGEMDHSAVNDESTEHDDAQPTTDDTKENKPEELKDEEEDGAKQMTLDEWKAMQEKVRVKAAFNIRKPGEGCDSQQWGKAYMVQKTKFKNEIPSGLIGEHHVRRPANDITSQLEINFGEQSRRGRGGRGAGMGRGRGMVESRGGRAVARGGFGRGERMNTASAPNFDDPEAFPALGDARP
uniref:SERPINE1 mRNA binding protein 1b n=1 Tax=Eptatretus burgeri TaxID=7764 RepID=A0A8C4QTA8_EPTBU